MDGSGSPKRSARKAKKGKKWFKDVQTELSFEDTTQDEGDVSLENDEVIDDEELIMDDLGNENLTVDMMSEVHGGPMQPAERFHGTGSSSLFSVDEFSTTDGGKCSEEDYDRDSPPPRPNGRGSGSYSAGKLGGSERNHSPQAHARPYSAPSQPSAFNLSQGVQRKERENSYKPSVPRREAWFKLDLKEKKYDKDSFEAFLTRQNKFLKSKRNKDEKEGKMSTSERLLHRGLISKDSRETVTKLLSPRKIGPEHEEFLARQKASADAKIKRIKAGPQLPPAYSAMKRKPVSEGSFQEFLERQQEVAEASIQRCKVPLPQKQQVISAGQFKGFLARQKETMEKTRAGIEETRQAMWKVNRPQARGQ